MTNKDSIVFEDNCSVSFCIDGADKLLQECIFKKCCKKYKKGKRCKKCPDR